MISAHKVHFPNLNGLRFVAALMVIFSHIEEQKSIFGLKSLNAIPYTSVVGALGVTLFFVLSGFLITYLLLAEMQAYSTISVKKFYSRRILRIWPLYYLVIILGLFVLPRIHFFDIPVRTVGINDHFTTKTILLFLILPNIVRQLYTPMAYILQTWSIGVEEQFYLVWPFVIKYGKNYMKIFLAIILVMAFMKTALFHRMLWKSNSILHLFSDTSMNEMYNAIWYFFWFFRIDCMAIGGIAAYLLFSNKQHVLRICFNKKIQFLSLLVLLVIPIREFPLFHEVAAVFIAILILNLAANPQRIFSLDKPIFEFLGKISYGIYMFHAICIIIVLKLLQMCGCVDQLLFNLFLYLLSILFTIVVAALSYYLFERRFLLVKEREFTNIGSA